MKLKYMNKKQKIKSYEKVRDRIKEETFANTDIFHCNGCNRDHYQDLWVLDHVEKRSQSQYWYDKPENLYELCSYCNILRESQGDSILKCSAEYKEIKQRLKDIYNGLTLEQKKE